MLYTGVFSLYDDEMIHINQNRFKTHMQFQVRDIKQNQSSASLNRSQ